MVIHPSETLDTSNHISSSYKSGYNNDINKSQVIKSTTNQESKLQKKNMAAYNTASQVTEDSVS